MLAQVQVTHPCLLPCRMCCKIPLHTVSACVWLVDCRRGQHCLRNASRLPLAFRYCKLNWSTIRSDSGLFTACLCAVCCVTLVFHCMPLCRLLRDNAFLMLHHIGLFCMVLCHTAIMNNSVGVLHAFNDVLLPPKKVLQMPKMPYFLSRSKAFNPKQKTLTS